MTASSPNSSVPEQPSAPRDPISSSLVAFLDLFRREFAGVVFPQEGGESLDAAHLESLVAQVREQAGEEAALEARLAETRAALGSSHRLLQAATKRAHAYARVFASGRPELLDALAEHRPSDRKLAPRKSKKNASAAKKRAAKAKRDADPDASQLKLAPAEAKRASRGEPSAA